jgi:hypothetical protein
MAGGLAVIVAGLLVDRFAMLMPGQADSPPELSSALPSFRTSCPAVIMLGAAA